MRCTIKDVMVCSDCIDNLETADQFYIWKRAIEKGFCTPVSDSPDHDYQYLEENGYILTTEVSAHTIKVKSCKSIGVMTTFGPCQFYCANRKQHLEHLCE